MGKTLKGKFRPDNPEKYLGDVGLILYRSSWEFKFMRWCDTREDIIAWNSEETRVRYYDPVAKRTRTYYPDFYIRRQRPDGIIIEELVEVKPARQVKGPPVNPKRKTRAWLNEVYTYATNTAKWKAASEFCEDRGWNFRIITENEIKPNR